MLKIDEAIIVEGKYDKIKLSSIIDGIIIVTNGFGIFKDREKLELIRYYAEKTGIIILTDSDSSGFKIRGYLKSAVNSGTIKNVYIPDIFGKERRKIKASSEGKMGVEGLDKKLIFEAFRNAGISASNVTRVPDIKRLTLYELGLSGKANSRELRQKLQKKLGLPSLMSTSSLHDVLNTMMCEADLVQHIENLTEE